jgi:hypothetical protein
MMNFIADGSDWLGIGDGRVVVVHGGWQLILISVFRGVAIALRHPVLILEFMGKIE